MAKKKKSTTIGLAKETVSVGAATIAGHSILGTMASTPGMPAAATPTLRTAGAGLGLVQVGQLAKVGIAIPKMMTGETTTKKKKSKSNQVNKILGL